LKKDRPLFFLFLLALALAVALLWLQEMERSRRPSTRRPPERRPQVARPGIAPKEESKGFVPPAPLPPPERIEKTPRPDVSPTPYQVAIVIDDLGFNDEDYRPFLEICYPLTFAILPSLPYSRAIAKELSDHGREVMLHLPLEPWEFPSKNPGRGVILSSMSPDQVRSILLQYLSSVPGVVGVNSHMGSRLTEDREAMRVILVELKRRNLYFLDSLTTRDTVVPSLARELGLRVGSRSIFLDNYEDRTYIEGQLKALVRLARTRGGAIAVGHPYPMTAAVLKGYLPYLEREGVRLVTVSKLIH
jgi:hypothetical protein